MNLLYSSKLKFNLFGFVSSYCNLSSKEKRFRDLKSKKRIKEKHHETSITIQSKINFRKWKIEKSYISTNSISSHKIIFPFDIQLYYCVLFDINIWKIVIFPMNINFVALSRHLRLYRVGIIKKLLRHFQFLHMQHT